jgi:hypothetical protein
MGPNEMTPEDPPEPPPDSAPPEAPEQAAEAFNAQAAASPEPALTDSFNAAAEVEDAELPPEEPARAQEQPPTETFNAAAEPQDAELPPEEPAHAQEQPPTETFNAAAEPQDAELPPEPAVSPTPWARELPRESTAEAENARHQAECESRGQPFEPPYQDGTPAYAALTEDSNLRTSRAYTHEAPLGHPQDPGAVGRWSTSEDMTTLTPQELQQRFALPQAPNHLVDLHHPAQQEIVAGTAGGNQFNDHADAGGLQLESLDQRDKLLASPKADWNAGKGEWEPRLSGTFNRAANPELYPPDSIFNSKTRESPDDA